MVCPERKAQNRPLTPFPAQGKTSFLTPFLRSPFGPLTPFPAQGFQPVPVARIEQTADSGLRDPTSRPPAIGDPQVSKVTSTVIVIPAPPAFQRRPSSRRQRLRLVCLSPTSTRHPCRSSSTCRLLPDRPSASSPIPPYGDDGTQRQ